MDGVEKAIGVTRVARVTGLDRAGVEVACAVRPSGHVLQVSNGKGITWGAARASAVAEAAELWAAERPADVIFAPRGERWELRSGRLAEARAAWVAARELETRAEVFVPAHAVYCPPPGAPSLGPAAVRWSSNGMGAAPTAPAALRHALAEAVERDQLARALPEGFTPQAVRARKVRPPASLAPLLERLSAVRLETHCFDLRADLDVPVAGAILVDAEDGPVPLTAGYACRPRPEEAFLAALLEAAQSRLTDVHGAREDVTAPDRAAAAALAAACRRAKALPLDMPRFRDPLAAVRGRHRLAAVTLARAPLFVVKLLSPTLQVSELL